MNNPISIYTIITTDYKTKYKAVFESEGEKNAKSISCDLWFEYYKNKNIKVLQPLYEI